MKKLFHRHGCWQSEASANDENPLFLTLIRRPAWPLADTRIISLGLFVVNCLYRPQNTYHHRSIISSFSATSFSDLRYTGSHRGLWRRGGRIGSWARKEVERRRGCGCWREWTRRFCCLPYRRRKGGEGELNIFALCDQASFRVCVSASVYRDSME